ncbi:MAG: hypothetical protein RLZZ77_652 [Bacteroidota bacterium]
MAMKFWLGLCFILAVQLCPAQNQRIEPDFNYQYAAADTVEGYKETARRVKYYMDSEQYDLAISYFSKKQQEKIAIRRQSALSFADWLSAWKINDLQMLKYFQMMEQRKGNFIFEDGVWKIDEQ